MDHRLHDGVSSLSHYDQNHASQDDECDFQGLCSSKSMSMREKTQDGRNIPPAQYPGMSHSTVEPYSCTARGCSVPSSGEKHVLGYAAHTQNAF